jgi:alkylation response protein AidB-like acyl-CoA dehydrogenase
MLLTEDQQMIREALRSFVQEQITPHAAAWRRWAATASACPSRTAVPAWTM